MDGLGVGAPYPWGVARAKNPNSGEEGSPTNAEAIPRDFSTRSCLHGLCFLGARGKNGPARSKANNGS